METVYTIAMVWKGELRFAMIFRNVDARNECVNFKPIMTVPGQEFFPLDITLPKDRAALINFDD
jgi:hypothetical protein